MFTDLKTATQFALGLASQLQNAYDNADVATTGEAWHDLADDFQKLVVFCNTTAARFDAAADDAATRYKPEGAVLYDGTPGSGSIRRRKPVTDEQLDALRKYARTYGRTWKNELRSDWLSACASVDPDIAGQLQQLRNSHGPAWLTTFKLD
jgi:hypothetical protein